MKNKFRIIIILVLLFCSGCSVDYDLKINNDLSVEESFVALETKEKLKTMQYNSLDEVIENNKRLTVVDTKKYFINKYTEKDLMGVKVNRNYDSISKYIEQLNNYDWFLNSSSYTVSQDVITIKSDILFEANEEYVNLLHMIDAKINIKVPFEVVSHNADSVDLDNNVYTWNIKNYLGEDELYISFDKTKKKSSKVGLIIIGAISLVVLLLVFYVLNKFKNQNKV